MLAINPHFDRVPSISVFQAKHDLDTHSAHTKAFLKSVDLSPKVRYDRIKAAWEAIQVVRAARELEQPNSDAVRQWNRISTYLYGIYDFYSRNALCEHCGKKIFDRNHDGLWEHEDGEIGTAFGCEPCDGESDFRATPAHVLRGRLSEVAA